MDLHRTIECLAMLLCVCIRCTESDVDKGLFQTSRLIHKWLLSIKESHLNEKDVLHSHPMRKVNSYQLLYCRIGIGFHLQILTNGSVGGVHEPTEHSWLRVFAMKPGEVGIRGIKSRLFLCMNKEGIVQAMKQFSPDCLFKEQLEENHYTTYSSAAHPGLFLALSHRGQVKRGNTVGLHHASTHFLPRDVPMT